VGGERVVSRSEAAAAIVLMRTGPVAALVVLGVGGLATVLVPAGWWRSAVVVPLLLPVVAGAVWLIRVVPAPSAGSSPRSALAGGHPVGRVPVWTALVSLAIAIAFGVWAGLTRGEHLVLRRDAGSYALFAHWLATRHGLPVDVDLASFGGSAALGLHGFTLGSPGFFEVVTGADGPGGAIGVQVVPQFLLGAPALYSLGWWAAGWTGLFVAPAVIGAFAVLAAAGLAARVVGPRWAPVAAAELALVQPVLHAARSTLSEPPALLLVLAVAALAVDATGRRPGLPGARRLGLLAGAVLGLAGLVRVDVLREVAVAVPVCAVLALRRNRAAVPFAAAALAGVGLSMVPAWFVSRPYLYLVGASLRPLVLATVGLTGLSAFMLWFVRGRFVRGRFVRGRLFRGRLARAVAPAGSVTGSRAGPLADRWLPTAAAFVVVGVATALAARPLWMTARQDVDDSAVPLIASLQNQQGLPVDGTRTYAERSVEWLLWYVGPLTATAAVLATAVLAARAVRWWRAGGTGAAPEWLLPLGVAFGSVTLTLYRPGITPDHPWADRRLVPVALPAMVLAATAATAWVVERIMGAGRGSPGRWRWLRPLAPAVGAVLLGALLWPAAQATLPLAGQRTERGEPGAVADVCAALRPGDVVVAVEDAAGGIRAQNEWVQVVRGVCGHPSAALVTSPGDRPPALARLGALVSSAGGRLVLLTASENDEGASGPLVELGLAPRRATFLRTLEDQHLLARRPFDVDALVIDVWVAVWEPGGETRSRTATSGR
jgi:hypothetical protein